MNPSSIEERVKDLVIAFAGRAVPKEQVTRETSLLEDLDFDSVRVIELILAIEEELDLTLEEADLTMDAFDTLGSLIDYLGQRLTGPSSEQA